MFVIALIPILLMIFDRSLSRLDGVILVFVFAAYMWHLARERKEIRKKFDNGGAKHILVTIAPFLVSLCILFFSANFIVKYAMQLSLNLLLSPIVLGLFLISIGMSLPELVFETRAVLAKKGDLAIGDAMGSVVCNSTLVLGVTAIIFPITFNFLMFLTSSIVMALITFLFMIFIRSKKGLSIMNEVTLILMYILFIMFEFYLKPTLF